MQRRHVAALRMGTRLELWVYADDLRAWISHQNPVGCSWNVAGSSNQMQPMALGATHHSSSVQWKHEYMHVRCLGIKSTGRPSFVRENNSGEVRDRMALALQSLHGRLPFLLCFINKRSVVKWGPRSGEIKEDCRAPVSSWKEGSPSNVAKPSRR